MGDIFSSLGQGSFDIVRSIFEIAILTVMIYVIVRFIRGTRGAGVAKGGVVLTVVLFVMVLFIARWLQLENVRWIMENLVAVSMIGVLVIFQPEIRRGLIRLGESAWRFYGLKGQTFEKDVTDAAFAISRNGEPGAIIVIERETPIAGYMESGILLDAEISSRLLTTIFTKNTPLHDGAVIIRQMRIAAANCLLPLSENIEVCRGMGTRHRAAIGLSEESDSIVVVVSEETGAVSVAFEGRIIRDLDYEGLLAFIREKCADISTPTPAMEEN